MICIKEVSGGGNMATRPLTVGEYRKIIELIINGFTYIQDGTEKTFRPNSKLALALQLQASLGLRIGDVLELKETNFKGGKLELREDKTNKLQYRDVNLSILNAVNTYVLTNGIAKDDKLFNRLSVRAVQKSLKIVTNYLGLENVSTHSFRKLYAVTVYETNNNNIELVKELLNHTSIATTQRYIRVSQQAINKASKEINFIVK